MWIYANNQIDIQTFYFLILNYGNRSIWATSVNTMVSSFNSSPPSAAYVCQRIWSALLQIMAFRLFGDKPLSKPMLGYCQLDLGNKFQWNFNQNSKFFIHENATENVVCETPAILSRGGWDMKDPVPMGIHIFVPSQREKMPINSLFLKTIHHVQSITLQWHHMNVWRIKSPATRLFINSLFKLIKASHYWPFIRGESIGDRWILLKKGQ